MSRPITPTPRLGMEESKRFLEEMEKDKGRKMGPVPTPRVREIDWGRILMRLPLKAEDGSFHE